MSESVAGDLSEEAALEEARVAYLGYLRAIEDMGSTEQVSAEELRPFVVSDSIPGELSGLSELIESGLKFRGNSELVAFELQSYTKATGELSAYACVDLSAARVVNGRGEDVTPSSRPNRQTSLPQFFRGAGTMKLVENATWSGTSIC